MSGFTVLTRNNVASRRPSNNLPLSIACPTRDLSSLEYVSQLVHQGAAYQVIPATQHPFNYNAEDILVGILPKTKYSLGYLGIYCWTSHYLFTIVATTRRRATTTVAILSLTKGSSEFDCAIRYE